MELRILDHGLVRLFQVNPRSNAELTVITEVARCATWALSHPELHLCYPALAQHTAAQFDLSHWI